MKHLTSMYWKNFKSDGKLFEQLSKALIEYEYGQTDFYIVGGPGDGGKDVCKDIPLLGNYHTQIWAQCKFYSRTLSFDDISFTLLMAYLKNTNQILIFSYSKVSATFLENLNEYITRTAKDVILYADEELEDLIIKHRDKLTYNHPEFFPTLPNYFMQTEAGFKVDYQLYIDDRRITAKEVTISINSICELAIVVTNKTLETQNIRLAHIKNRTAQAYDFLDNKSENTVAVAANHSVAFITHIRLKHSVSDIFLPDFELSSNNMTQRIHSTIKLNCRWLADTALIGNQYYRALEKITSGIQYAHFHLAYVYGKSGVGKSRLLKEVQNQCVRIGKRMIFIDAEKKGLSCKRFIELLCSKMTLLPLFHEKIAVMSNGGEIAMEYATRILYDSSFDIAEEWENVSKFLAYLMESEKCVLALDNLQSFDKLSLQILDYLITLLKNAKCESDILLGINTDYVYKNSAFDNFFIQIKYASTSAPEYYTDIMLEGFEPCDSELYVRECLTYHSGETNTTYIHYDRAVRKIAEHCGNNPFFIQQYLLYLNQKGIIRRSPNTLFYFYDAEKFLESFHEMPQSIDLLIREREKLLLSNETDDFIKKYLCLVYLINITKSLPEVVYYDVFGDPTILNTLLDMGFFSLSDDCIVSIHSYYSLFYNVQYSVSSTPEDLLNRFARSLEKLNFTKDMAFPYFWAKCRLGEACFSDLQLVLVQISSWNFDCAAFSFCLESVNASVEKHYCELGINLYIKFYKDLCTKLDETLGIGESVFYYDRFLTFFLAHHKYCSEYTDTILSLITSYFIHLVNLEEYEKCMHAMTAVAEVLGNFSQRDHIKFKYQINRCQIMIYNRNDIVPQAVKAAKENLRILYDENMDPNFRDALLPSAKRSIGNTFFYSTSAYTNRQKIVDSWTDSFDCYVGKYGMDTETDFSVQAKVAAFAKGLAADIISGSEREAAQKAAFFKNALDKMNMAYYEMQIRLLMAIYLTWKWSKCGFLCEHIAEIEGYIDQTLDIAAIYGRQLTTINAFHMRAVVYFLAENYDLALDNYTITANLLMNYLKTEKDYVRWEYFWVDFARTLRRCRKARTSLSCQYGSQNIQKMIQKICSMSDHEFQSYEKQYVPMTAITDQDCIINFPKL